VTLYKLSTDRGLNTILLNLFSGDRTRTNITLSISDKNRGAWLAWKNRPGNRNTSESVMRLIRRDLHENPQGDGNTL